jgi:hypothetical protein
MFQKNFKYLFTLLCLFGGVQWSEAGVLQIGDVTSEGSELSYLQNFSEHGTNGEKINAPGLGMEITKINDFEYNFGDQISMYLRGHPTVSLLPLTCIMYRNGGVVGFDRHPNAIEFVLIHAFIQQLCSIAPLHYWVEGLASKSIT